MTNTIKPGDTVYLVKYALSSGIQEGVVNGVSQNNTLAYLQGFHWYHFRIGCDVVADRAEAVGLADAMRVKKIASLCKLIAKLEKMDFTEIKESKDG